VPVVPRQTKSCRSSTLFRTTPPPQVVVHVAADMSCHLRRARCRYDESVAVWAQAPLRRRCEVCGVSLPGSLRSCSSRNDGRTTLCRRRSSSMQAADRTGKLFSTGRKPHAVTAIGTRPKRTLSRWMNRSRTGGEGQYTSSAPIRGDPSAQAGRSHFKALETAGGTAFGMGGAGRTSPISNDDRPRSKPLRREQKYGRFCNPATKAKTGAPHVSKIRWELFFLMGRPPTVIEGN